MTQENFFVTKCLFDTIKDISAKILPSNEMIILSNEKTRTTISKNRTINITFTIFYFSWQKQIKFFEILHNRLVWI